MRNVKTIGLCSLVLLLALPLISCGTTSAPEGTPYELYFCQTEENLTAGEDAIVPETIYLSSNLRTTVLARTLLNRLLEGPSDPELKSAIPAGTSLQSLSIQNHQLNVDLTYPYSTQSGIALTMADYCITLTLTQVEEIDFVRITVRGQELEYRDQQNFSAKDVLFSSTEDVVGTVNVTLYFPDANGILRAESRVLQLYEGDTQLDAVLDALQDGPSEGSALLPSLPEGFSIRGIWQEGITCYVNLPSSALPELEGTDLTAAALSLVYSLGSLPQIEEVQFLVDGEYAAYYNDLAIGEVWPVEVYQSEG